MTRMRDVFNLVIEYNDNKTNEAYIQLYRRYRTQKPTQINSADRQNADNRRRPVISDNFSSLDILSKSIS